MDACLGRQGQLLMQKAAGKPAAFSIFSSMS
jgi:hypothetical protein